MHALSVDVEHRCSAWLAKPRFSSVTRINEESTSYVLLEDFVGVAKDHHVWPDPHHLPLYGRSRSSWIDDVLNQEGSTFQLADFSFAQC